MAAAACSNCRHWSQWLPNLGDCMRYAYDRQQAMLAAAFDGTLLPVAPAESTEPDHSCEKHEARS